MKKLLLIVFLLSSFNTVFASKKKQRRKRISKQQKILKAVQRNVKGKNWNVALYYLFAYLKKKKKVSERDNKLAEQILSKTGTLPLYLYNVDFIDKVKVPSAFIHQAHYNFKAKNYEKAWKYASMVPKKSNYYPEARFVMGSSRELQGKKNFVDYMKQCIKTSNEISKSIYDDKFKRYFILVKEYCVAGLARSNFRLGKYKKSNAYYDRIPKTSYSWPYILMEKAWNHYHMGDYNRTLGISMTYQSPLLESYFFPEVEVLKALSYFNLCLYRDAAFLIDKFFKVYKERSKTLTKFIKSSTNDKFYFDLVYNKKEKIKQHPYILSLRNQLRKKLRVNLHLLSYQKARDEYQRLLKNKKKKNDRKFLRFTLDRMEKIINKHVKEYFYFFINQINFFSYEMFNIKLEIISRRKDLVYDNKKLVSSRARGSYDNVNRESDEFFYTFNGAFWADELGDYSFGLKSNCKAVKKRSKK